MLRRAQRREGSATAPGTKPRRRRWVLTAAVFAAAVGFVAVTVGSSLAGSTSFYAGGLLVNQAPWIDAGYGPVQVTNNFVGDTIDGVIPSRSQHVDRALAGDWPGWNPYQGAGDHFGTVPNHGLLSPPGLAWWVLPHDLAPGYEKLSVLLLAAVGTALFLRRLGTGWHAAWVGGMVFAGSGFMMAWTNWPHAGVAALLPWLFWAVERALQVRTWPSAAPVALAVAFLLLGGFPAVTGLGLYAAAGYVLLRVATRALPGARRWSAGLADVGRLAAALVTGFLLAGVQLVVFAVSVSELDTGYRDGAFDRLVPLRQALTSVFPHVWGRLGGGPFNINPIEFQAYLGVAAVVLLVVALLLPAAGTVRGARGYFLGVLVLGFLLVYVQGPPLEWVGALPVFAGNPIGRLISVVLLAGSVLAGLGFSAVADRAEPLSRAGRVRLGAGLALLVAALGAATAWAAAETAGELARSDTYAILALAGAGGLVTVLAVVVARWRPAWRAPVLAVVPVVVAVQAATAATSMWAQVDRSDFFPVTPAHEFLIDAVGSDRMAVTGRAFVNGSTAYYRLRSATGHAFTPVGMKDLQRELCADCQASPTYWVLPAAPDPELWTSPLLDRMGVRYLTSETEYLMPGQGEYVHQGDGELRLPAEGASALEVPVPGGPTRGVVLTLREAAAGTSGHVRAELRDGTGALLLRTTRFVSSHVEPMLLPVPMAGEDLPPGDGWTLRLEWAGSARPPVLAGNDQGLPDLTVVRPVPDGLRLVHDGDAVVWERLGTLPRIRWAERSRVVPSPEARVRVLTRPAVPDETVVLSEPGPATDGLPASVEVLEDSGDRVRVEVDAEGAGYLVLADGVQSHWSVTVDGEAREVVAADHAFGAVHVPAGRHQVTFSYEPRGERAGLVASLVGLAALAAMILPAVVRLGRRRRGSSRPAGTAPAG